jgi:hypothetical protein
MADDDPSASTENVCSERRALMNQQPFEPPDGNHLLTQVYEGMPVYDSTGQKIGTVEGVYLGAVSAETSQRGDGPATASSPDGREGSLIEDFAKAIAPQHRLPETLRERLLRQGFIRIHSSGFFVADRYAMPAQIDSVSGDHVVLYATRDELLK